MDSPESPKVPGGCLYAAMKLGKDFSTTIFVGGGALIAAPTNEMAAYIVAGTLAFDVLRLAFKQGKEQLAANLGVTTSLQKDTNKDMEKQIAERQAKLKQYDEDPLSRLNM